MKIKNAKNLDKAKVRSASINGASCTVGGGLRIDGPALEIVLEPFEAAQVARAYTRANSRRIVLHDLSGGASKVRRLNVKLLTNWCQYLPKEKAVDTLEGLIQWESRAANLITSPRLWEPGRYESFARSIKTIRKIPSAEYGGPPTKLSVSTGVQYQVDTSRQAWALMESFRTAGIVAGYPSLKPESGYYTVRVRAEDKDRADVVFTRRLKKERINP